MFFRSFAVAGALICASGCATLTEMPPPAASLSGVCDREGATPTDIPVMHPETFDPLRRRVVFDALDSSGSSTGTTGENGSPNNVDGGGNGGPDTSNLGPANDPAGDSPPTVAPPDQGPTGSGLPVSGNLLLSGASRSASDLTLDNGLTMDAASLYVDGNLVIRGRLEGFGVLVVKGDITVDAGASLEGANQLAVLSGGKVTLRGVGPSSTVIRGIFYAEDGIEAHQMTVIGALIAGGENASILLDDVAVYTSEAVQGQVAQTSGGPLMKGAKTYEIMQDPFSQAFRQAGPGDGSDQPLADILDPESNPQPGGLPTVSTGGPSSFISVRERMKVVTWIER